MEAPMKYGRMLFAATSVIAAALWCQGADARGATAGGTAVFGRLGGFHRFPTPANHLRFRPRLDRFGEFRRLRVTSTTVVGDDDGDDYDTAPSMHFRAEESFGPWDIPIRPMGREPPPPPPEPGYGPNGADYGPDGPGSEPPPAD
jgi:hypothetical protein